MKKILYALFFIATLCPAQEANIETINFKLSDKINPAANTDCSYPKIITGNKEIDSVINQQLFHAITREELQASNYKESLNDWAKDGVVNLGYTVNYNNNGIISLNIDVESCGAYCEDHRDYYTFSLSTGKMLTIDDLINIAPLKDEIYKEKEQQYIKQRKTLKERSAKDPELDEKMYKTISDKYDECENSFEIKEFALYEDHIEIMQNCYFNYAWRALMPYISIKLELSEIKQHLKTAL